MIPVTTRKDQTIALFGLGGSGKITAKALVEGGANVVAFDDNPASVEAASADGIPTADLREFDFSKADALVLAPGVPLTHPRPHWTVELANANDVPLIGDIELFAQERRAIAPDSQFIAITGTNGKSTTTALISHMLSSGGKNVQMGGNIGKAVLSLDALSDDKIYVVECSSYQIDLAPSLDPSVGILLNLSPDHLDRHGTMENYAAIKSRLVEASETAIIGIDDDFTKSISYALNKKGIKPITVSVKSDVEFGYRYRDGSIYPAADGFPPFNLRDAQTLRGIHNAQNAMAAVAACFSCGLDHEEIHRGLNSFPGLTHRMEIIGNVGTTVFVNDSKGTNADAAAMALSSFENIYWIAGGLAKEGGIESLRPLFGRVRKAFLIGEAAPEFSAVIGKDVPYEIAGTIDVAVKNAAGEAKSDCQDAFVVLSPACASFDQYKNFEERGDAFRKAVENLEGFVSYGGKH